MHSVPGRVSPIIYPFEDPLMLWYSIIGTCSARPGFGLTSKAGPLALPVSGFFMGFSKEYSVTPGPFLVVIRFFQSIGSVSTDWPVGYQCGSLHERPSSKPAW